MREKKTPDGPRSAPADNTEQLPGEVSPENPVDKQVNSSVSTLVADEAGPLADSPENSAEKKGVPSGEPLPDGSVPPEQPAESGISDSNPETALAENEPVDSNAPVQSDTSGTISQQQQADVEPPPTPTPIDSTNPPARAKSKGFKFSLLQKVLMVVVLISAALLTFSLVLSLRKPTLPAPALVTSGAISETSISKAKADAAKSQTQHNKPSAKAEPSAVSAAEQPAAGQAGPLSLQFANNYYAAKDYVRAYNAYEQLHKNLTGQDFELTRNFLQFRMALCMEKKGYSDKANQIFKAVAETCSPVLRALANYHSSLLEMNASRYLNARTRAYKAIALTGLLSADCDWALTLERDGSYVAAEAVTREVLSLCDADRELPEKFLSGPEEQDRLGGLNETELQAVLNLGIQRLNNGLLAPQIHPAESISGSSKLNRWLVVCNGPSIEEFMARFAANASLDVRWARLAEDGEPKRSDTAGWNRPVTLYLPAATAQQVAATAAGAAGLLARIDDVDSITITNPAEYSALSEHTRQLSENAMWLWRTFLLMYSDDTRIPNVHFALGVLQENRNRPAEAITEYKLVANRYSQTPIAPFALLRSSRLKTTLRDYAGAGRDLKELIEQYPDNSLVGQAHLNLARTTMKAGHYDEACSLYRKAYNLGFSTESRTIAAFGAGCCFYQMKDYENTVKWLTRYLDCSKKQQPVKTAVNKESQSDADSYTAYLLLGKANLALGNLEAACSALNHTVRSASASDEYVEAVCALVDAQIKQKNFVAALGTVENVRAWPFSQEQVTRLLLLKSNILREMGLADQAVTILIDKAPYLTDSRLKADIMLELSKCYTSIGNLDLARAHLTKAVSLVEPGPKAYQANLDLAKICLKLGDYQQTILICTKLLETSTCEQIKQEASKVLASAYSRKQNYEKAAEALLTASVLPDTTKSNAEKN